MNEEKQPVGFRLHYMEFLNWGTFHRNIWRINPQGNNSLLTGAVGSGKSTVVDALTCLIVPHHKITFNKAAGAESKERNLMSYVKGNYSSKSDEVSTAGKAITLRYKDPSDATFTVIVADFYNAGYNTHISLAQLFWIENDAIRKLLLISSKPLSIKEYFTRIGDVKELKKRLRAYPFIETFDENFAQYSQRFRQLFGMTSDKAIDLFYQTVSMKSVTSLTAFVREQMLERTDIRNQIEELKKRFDDLNKAYAAVLESRKQRDVLQPLVVLDKEFGDFERRIKETDEMIQSIPCYFAEKKLYLLQEEIETCSRKLKQLESQLAGIREQLEARQKARTELQIDIRSNGGGRLEQIDAEMKSAEEERKRKQERYKQYQQLNQVSGLQAVNTEQAFFRNLKSTEQKIKEIQLMQQTLLEEHGKASGERTGIDNRITEETRELESLRKRVNQIPSDILEIRTQLSVELGIKEEEIPFVGELLKVNEHEKEWEGALERLLRGFGISLLVPDKYYAQVSGYVNASKLMDKRNKGVRLEYFRIPVGSVQNQRIEEPDANSVVNKIDIKPNTPFGDWLEVELMKRFNLRCVSLEEFKRQADVITKEGQIKTGRLRHVKDDRRDLWDRRNFVLGWSNKEKMAAIEEYVKELRLKQKALSEALQKLSAGIDQNNSIQATLHQLLGYTNWNDLNWQEEANRKSRLEEELRLLKESNNMLKTLQEQLLVTENEICELNRQQEQIQEEKGKQKERIESAESKQLESRTLSEILLAEEKECLFPQIEKEVGNASFTVHSIDRVRDTLSKTKMDERRSLSEKQSRVRDKIIKQLKEYKNQFPSDSMELSDEIEARSEYLQKLHLIIQEGLPAHEERLKKMLNENTINDIVAFDNKLDMHAKKIQEKIGIINEHLEAIEFNKGTFIKLLAVRNSDIEIKKFKADLKACYSNILNTEDAYTEDRFNDVQKILNRFRSNDSKDIEWTNKVTDVREWFLFNASERYRADDEEKEFYAGTSGKSGGQKEKLAYTILASALAYQFGLTYDEPRSKSFRFVVIDEAFGRGDDESTQFGLDLFKKLDLQLLIVTPLQKIHVIENYIHAVHYVSNMGGNNSQLQNLTVEEYKAEKSTYNIQIIEETE